jgi:hypothetical protein
MRRQETKDEAREFEPQRLARNTATDQATTFASWSKTKAGERVRTALRGALAEALANEQGGAPWLGRAEVRAWRAMSWPSHGIARTTVSQSAVSRPCYETRPSEPPVLVVVGYASAAREAQVRRFCPVPANNSLQRTAPVVAHGKQLRFIAAQHLAGVTPRAEHASRHRLIESAVGCCR